MVLDKWLTDMPTWHLADLCGTVVFAAYRILERSYPDDINEAQGDDVDRMAIAVDNLDKATGNVINGKHDALLQLNRDIELVLNESVRILAVVMRRHGNKDINQWLPIFKEYQSLLRSASRYLQQRAFKLKKIGY
jgi:hypothetical protein